MAENEQARKLPSADDQAKFRELNGQYLAAVRAAKSLKVTLGETYAPVMAMITCKAWYEAVSRGAPQLLAPGLSGRGYRGGGWRTLHGDTQEDKYWEVGITIEALATAPEGTLACLNSIPDLKK